MSTSELQQSREERLKRIDGQLNNYGVTIKNVYWLIKELKLAWRENERLREEAQDGRIT